MLRRAFLAAAPLAMLADPSGAADAPKKNVGQYVDLQPVGMPIVIEDRLVNYVFVHVRINLTSGANSIRLREKEPYFRDALVRAGHRTPFNLANDYQKVDEKRLAAVLTREVEAIAGSGVVRSVVVTSQSPQRRARIPAARS